jgi:peptidoglycan/xylan/chitin deacetylase (PgdA/CDA1 family)
VRAILTFHSVDDSGSVLSIAPDDLGSLVDAVRASGHRIVPLRELLDSPDTPRALALTFDDGMQSLYDNALPVLRDLDAPATVFLTTGWLGRDNRWPGMPESAPRMRMLDWPQVHALRDAGWAVEAHTVNHPDLRTLSEDAIEQELAENDDAIARELGEAPEVFAYPYGHHDDRVADVARRRYRYAVTASMGTLPKRIEDPMRVPRLETFYFRSPHLHRGFDGARFRAYLALRSLMRRLRHGA